uniref:Uncharacterized protein n=1 Tax=mine drainage metagenome TaxID=410659 RepID=E6QLC0_9ZZZZ
MGCGFEFAQDAVAAGSVGVADIDAEADAGRDGVDGSGEDFAEADGGDGIDGMGGKRGAFEGKDQLGGGGDGVVAVGHEHGSGVAALALYGDPESGGSGDGGDNTDVEAVVFEGLALLDVQFDKGVEVAGGEADAFERADEAAVGAERVERAAFGVAEGERLIGRQNTAHETTAQASDTKAGRFFAGEEDEFDGAGWLEASLLERANGFERAEDADRAVEGSGVGNGVNVRAGGDGGKVGLCALPASEGVANGVVAEGESGVCAEQLDKGARAKISLGEDDAGDDGRLGL